MRSFPLFIIAVLALACALTPTVALAADEKSVVGGTVYLDKNRDASPAGDSGLRGVQITLTGPKSSKRETTDAKGGYSFDELPAGRYTVTAAAPAGHQLTSAPTITVNLDGKNAVRVIDFGVATVAATPSPSPSPTSPSPSPTSSASVTPTPTFTATPSSPESNLVQRPNAVGSPQTSIDVTSSIELALDEPARLAGSPGPIDTPTATITPTATMTPTATITPTATPDGGRGGVPDEAVRLRAASLEPLRYAAGRDRLANVKRWENGETLWLSVPFRTQMDGTYFSEVNCGPASLAMAMSAFGITLDPNSIREYVNFISGNVDPDAGTSLDHIARVAREAGLRTLDLYGARGYRAWDLDLVRQHVAQGHPVITLTRYQSLPGNANSQFLTDHYVVITGLSGDDFIYNDPAFGSNAGYGLLISGPDLERAWVFSSIPGHSMALALDGDAQIPDWLRRRAESRATANETPEPEKPSEESEVEVADAMPAVGQVPGDQELPEVNVDTMAQTLLDLLAAPRLEERAYIANTDAVAAVLPDEAAESLVIAAADDALALPPNEDTSAPRTVRLAEVFILDPTLVTLFLALLGIFLSPAISRRRGRP